MAVCSIVAYIASNRGKYHWRLRAFIYVAMIFLLGSMSVSDKREAIFVIFPIILVESYYGRWVINLKIVLSALPILSALLIMILAMSISRGYGSFGSVDFLDSFLYVLPYIKSDNFISGVMNNLEFNYVFFHSINAVESVLNDSGLLEFGSTLIKFFFIPIPRSIFPEKPDSIIHLYTNHFDPILRELG